MGSNRGLSRRSFFQQTGAAVAALGLTNLAVNSMAELIGPNRQALGQALAASTGRKLALLVGIDNYPSGTISPDRSAQLAGAATDVALQKELLIHRFGFLPDDIVCLTNKQATRSGIYQAVIDHLYNQAEPADTVVFHFSGYGAQVRVADLVGGQTAQRSLVPYDGQLPSETRPVLNDILENELKALLKKIKARNITTVLDAGFVDFAVPLSGGLRSRARPVIATGRLSAPFPLLATQKSDSEDAPFPGILMRGAKTREAVVERQWNGFNAGAFTYVLTQYLWTAPAPVSIGRVIGRSQENLLRWGGGSQQPAVSSSRSIDFDDPNQTIPIYNTPLINDTRAEAVVQSVNADGQKATLWLGGFPPRVLEYLGTPTVVTCGNSRLKVRSRDGLTAKAQIIDAVKDAASNSRPSLQPGQFAFEAVRTLPKKIDLVVALDSRLERIERVDATSALSVLSFVNSTSDTDLPADCLLAKPIAEASETLTASSHPVALAQPTSDPTALSQAKKIDEAAPTAPVETPANNADLSGYGLFSLTRSLIPGTLSLQEEAIKPAISRLTPKLQSLLALKMLRLSENRSSSQVPVRVALEMISPEEKLLINRQTFHASPPVSTSGQGTSYREGFFPEVPIGSRIRYQLFNHGERPLYYTLINVDPRERLSAFCPVTNETAATTETDESSADTLLAAAAIAPGSSISIPSADLDWAVDAPTGPVETYVVCSSLPLTKTFELLQAASAASGGQRVNPLPEPLAVIEAILTDISQGDDSDAYTLDVSEWATLNFTYLAV